MYKLLLLLLMTISLAACHQAADDTADTEPAAAAESPVGADGPDEAPAPTLEAVLAAQPEEARERYAHRHPQETIEFIGIEPGMTVVEGLPGGGWYTKILVNYLGSDGRLIGANYAMDMWPLFPFGTEEFVAEMETWIDRFKTDATGWGGGDGAEVDAFYFGSMPESLHGTADVVFFPRVLHNLANFQNAGEGPYLDTALADAFNALKPGGVFGVVQHEARDSMSDEFADGSHGYLKKSFVIEQAEKAGFEFVAESAVNENPRDLPGEEDIVWRLPPSYAVAGDDAEKRAAASAIGESNRMTLKFRKP